MGPNPAKLEKQVPVVLPDTTRERGLEATLGIAGIEVIQAIQRYTVTDPAAGPPVPDRLGAVGAAAGLAAGAAGGPVPLVSKKRTLARVYVALAAALPIAPPPAPHLLNVPQPETTDEINVTGTLTLTPVGLEPVDAGPPLNPFQARAKLFANLDRATLDDSLNFSLPVDLLMGSIQLDVEVQPADPIFGVQSVQGSTTVDFTDSVLPKKLIPMIVHNGRSAVEHTMDDYNNMLDQVRACYPAADESFDPLPPLRGNDIVYDVVQNDSDLTTEDGWTELFGQIEEITSSFQMDGTILTVLLAQDPPPPGTVDLFAGRDNGPFAIFVDARGFAHELGHGFGLGHPPTPVPYPPIDDRLPTRTEDVGIDMSRLTAEEPAGVADRYRQRADLGGLLAAPELLVLPDASEMMFPIVMSPWWISIASWNILFNEFRV
jgi:hypothetical protein